MKLIQEGHFEDKMRVVCTSCEAIFEITSKDVTATKTSLSVWSSYSFNCPCCKHKFLKDRSELTLGLAIALSNNDALNIATKSD